MEIRQDDPRSPAVAPLLAEHLAEQHGNVPPGFAFALDPEALAAPGLTFWTIWNDGALAGMGALKDLGDGTGEVKSMRTAAIHRGRGLAAAMLAHIAAEARARGWTRLNLETGTIPFYDAALALYRRAGFVACEPFADYQASPHNQFLTLALTKEQPCPPSS